MHYKPLLFFNFIFIIILSSSPIKHSGCGHNAKDHSSTNKVNVADYPLIRKDNKCVDKIFGHKIPCPYNYLDDFKSNETLSFIEKLNNMSSKILENIPIKNKMERKLNNYINYPKYSIFSKFGSFYYYFYNAGIKNHYVLMRRKNIYGKSEVFFNVEKYDKTGKTSIEMFTVSEDNKLMAGLLSHTGNDWRTIKFWTEDGKELNDTITNIQFTMMNFIFESKGFIYSKFKSIKNKNNLTSTTKYEDHSLYYHKMGTPESEDILIATFPKNKYGITYGYVSEDKNYLFVNNNDKTSRDKQMIYYLDLSNLTSTTIREKPKLKHLVGNINSTYGIVDSNKDEVTIITTDGAPMGKVVKLKISQAHKGKKAWKTLIKENKSYQIKGIYAVGKKYLLIQYFKDTSNQLSLYDKRNDKIINVIDYELDEIISISSSVHCDQFFVAVQNKFTPYIMYAIDLSNLNNSKKKTIKMNIVITSKIKGIKKSKFVMKKKFFLNKENIYIPLYIFHKKNLKLNGKNPVLLESYGSYGTNSWFGYNPSVLMFIKNFNGVYVFAGVRGGGDFGEEWHKYGTLLKKQNSFDDFIGSAQYLIKARYTNPSKLAIYGVSDSGLLMAVVAQQRPDLFKTVIITHGIFDMLRYCKSAFNKEIIEEYGNPKNKTEFENLLKYSPIHNLKMPKKPLQWPSTLLLTEGYDSRILSDTLKYAAQLYNTLHKGLDYQSNPVIVKISQDQRYCSYCMYYGNFNQTLETFGFIQKTLKLNWRD